MDTVTLTRQEYEDLQGDQMLLDCLRGAGVDNWTGYDSALELYQEQVAETAE